MKVKKIWKRALKGTQWLLDHQNPDGSWIGLEDPKVDAFYKGSWALTITGQPAAAHRNLNYAQQHFMSDDGDFVPRGHPWHYDVHYLYANAYFIVGSMLLGRYEIAMPAVQFLLSQQGPDHGGFYTRRVGEGQKELSDTMSAGAAGVACLAAGQMDAARRVGDFLAHIVEMQPSPQASFYTTVEADGQLGTEMADEDEAYWRIIDTQKKDQCWYAVGLPFAFLIRLTEATDDDRYRELAQWYFDFQERCVNPWKGGSSGKAGWASAMLYRITGDEHYRDIAFEVAEMIVDKQNKNGSWITTSEGYGEGEQESFTSANFDLNSEYTLWLALIASNILARDAK